MANQSRNHELMERAKDASLIHSSVLPFINDKVTQHVTMMVALYRGKQFTHDQLLGIVAEISALLSLTTDLEAQMRQGDIAAEKEFKNAPKA